MGPYPATVLRLIRQTLWGFTQYELATMLGIHDNTLARYERGELDIPKPIIKHISTMLERDAEKDKQARAVKDFWDLAIGNL